MTLDDIYGRMLDDVLEDTDKLKKEIKEKCNYSEFDVDKVGIYKTYEDIIDDEGRKALGAFWKDENKIEISIPNINNFVGNGICYRYTYNNDYEKIIKDEDYEKIFKYYVLYVIAHEMNHAYLYNNKREYYDKIKEEDKIKDYKDKKLEELADEGARLYLYSLKDNIAKFVIDMAVNLRIEKYNEQNMSIEEFIELSLKKFYQDND